jgi:LmbE family N-acetylglucosaminyl deacetylase
MCPATVAVEAAVCDTLDDRTHGRGAITTLCHDDTVTETLVCFHAHPDDEVILTGGTIARATDDGHRVVVVFATRGDHGEVAEGVLSASEVLADRRDVEARRAAEILGIARVEFLGYRDSGMADTDTNQADGSFWTADIDAAAARLAQILDEERADVFTTYDERGGYGHPDHIQAHRVGVRAAELARPDRVYAATVSRQHFLTVARDQFQELPADAQPPNPEDFDLGVDESRITTLVDVSRVIDRKRAAMVAHASQIPDESFFLALGPDDFLRTFGLEWYIRLDSTPATREDSLFTL